MKDTILSIDCSNRWTCIGLAIDGKTVGRDCDLGRAQAAQLPLLVEELLASEKLRLGDLTALAVTVGPGYFTGLRIGLAYAAALAFALSLEVVPLSSLEAVFRSVPDRDIGLKAPLIAASRELVFSSAYLDGKPVLDEKERTREQLADGLAPIGDAEMWAVDDARLFANDAEARKSVHIIENPSGAAMAALALERIDTKLKPDELRARYLREPGLGRSL